MKQNLIIKAPLSEELTTALRELLKGFGWKFDCETFDFDTHITTLEFNKKI